MAKRAKRKTSAHSSPAQSEAVASEPIQAYPTWVGVLAIIGVTFWVYLPAIGGDWLWDDDWYITKQPLLHDASGLWQFWFAPGTWVEYYPIEETLLWIEWHLFGLITSGYHLVTLSLHAVNALLVWRLLDKLGLRKAWLGGLIFAVHPAAVDSVAWIAETKNTVSALPCLLAMGAWVDYEDRRRPRDYYVSLLYFLIAMLCKIAVAPLPAVLLLYAWWKRCRVGWRDVTAVAPFLAIAVILSAVSLACGEIYAQHSGRVAETLPQLDLPERFALVGQSLGVYFAHIVWPVNLLPNYPQWSIGAGSPLAWIPWLVLVGVLVVLWRRRASWGGPTLLGLGFCLLFLAPFLGFLVASYMAFTWIMDHYLYLAMIGPIGLLTAALGSIEDRTPASWRVAITGASALIVTLLAFEAHAYAGVFSDEASLWGYTVAHNPGDWLAQDNLGKSLLLDNQPEAAMEHFHAVELLRPGRAQTHLSLGRALVALNRVPEAIAEYDLALAINPADPEIHNQKGVALLQAGRVPEALGELEEAVRLRPRYAIGLENLGAALATSGNFDEAVARFQESLAINPNDAATRVNLGRALHQLGRDAEAADQFRQALQLDPDNAAAKAGLAASSSTGANQR
jgi:tetratricopeptide (TPR) repeat protein